MFAFRFLNLSVACASLLLAAAAASAQTKVVIIDGQKALVDTAEMQKAVETYNAKFRPRQDEMSKLAKEIQDINDRLRSMAGKLTPQAEAEMQLDLQRKQKDYQRLGEDLQADSERAQTDLFSVTGPKMQAVLEKLAAEKGYDIILDISTTVYFKPALEITAEATAAYDAAHPVSAAAK